MTGLNDDYEKEFKKSKLLAAILLIGAPFAYLLLAYLIKVDVKSGGEVDMLFYILLIMAIVQPAVAPLVERFHLKRYRSSSASKMSPGQLFTSISIIKFALVEALYIYGLVVYIISGDTTRMLLFYPVGAIWSAVYWPRRSRWERFFQAVETK